MKNICVLLRLICLSVLLVFSIGSAVAATSYSLTVLKDKPDASRSENSVRDISLTGVVVGQAWARDFDNHAMIWLDTENPTDLTPFFGFSDSVASGINNREEVVVRKNNGTSILWINGVEINIAGSTGARVYARGINDSTQIVGNMTNVSPTGVGIDRAFIWENGVVTDLGTLPGGGRSRAFAINNFGQVAGSAVDAIGIEHAVMWDAGVITDLGILPGDDGSEAASINDAGVVVGRSFTTKEVTVGSNVYTVRDVVRAFTWSNGVMTELAGAGSSASDINNAGEIVGWVTVGSARHAVVWDNGLMMTDLNPFLNSAGCSAHALNDNGQIIGGCIDSNRVSFSFRLTPSDTAPTPIPGPLPPPADAEADVEVNISASTNKVKRGKDLDYTIVITNNGPDTAENVVVTDALPSNVNFISVSGTGCSGATTIICQLGDLGNGASETVFITVSPFKGRRVTNTVSVISSTDDPDTGNNTDKVKTRVRK